MVLPRACCSLVESFVQAALCQQAFVRLSRLPCSLRAHSSKDTALTRSQPTGFWRGAHLSSILPLLCCHVLLPQVRPDEVELIRRDYVANGGWETFLEYGDPRQDILIGLLRLRKISGAGEAWDLGISGMSRGVGSGGVGSVLRLGVPAWHCAAGTTRRLRVCRGWQAFTRWWFKDRRKQCLARVMFGGGNAARNIITGCVSRLRHLAAISFDPGASSLRHCSPSVNAGPLCTLPAAAALQVQPASGSRSCRAAAPSCASCMSTVLQWRYTRATRASSSTKGEWCGLVVSGHQLAVSAAGVPCLLCILAQPST